VRTAVLVIGCAALLAPAPARAQAAYETTPCFALSDAQGRGVFPPECDHGFSSHESAVILEAGLPPGTAVGGRLRVTKMNITTALDGGPLGGRIVNFTATLKLELRGMNGLTRLNTRVLLPLTGQFVTGPQAAGDTVQSFDFDLVSAAATLAPGDKDFASLQFLAGSTNGLPSHGHAVYTRQSDGEWACDTQLDLHYSLAFVGDPSGDLVGLSGTTVGHLRLLAGRIDNPPTALPESGAGSIVWPPVTADGRPGVTEGWFSAQRLNPARALLVRMNLRSAPGSDVYPGSPLGGGLSVSNDLLELEIFGEGAWGAIHRTLTVPVQTFINWGPEANHQPRQGRAADLYFLYGEIAGDPDFSLLRVSGGTGFGMPSLGHTTIEKQPDGDWKLDSSYDLTYRIEWTGAPGSTLDGQSGATQAVIGLQSGREREGDCEAPDDGTGSASFPPPCASGFVGEPAALAALNGLPTGSPLLARVQLANLNVTNRVNGGVLEGQTQTMTGNLVLTLQGTGDFAGYARTVTLPATVQTATAPYVKAPGPQHFAALVTSLVAALPAGDPEFASLTINGGEGASFSSPGHTTFTPAAGGKWNVESSLDIGYRLAFTGKPGGPFAGYGGTTDTRARLVAGNQPVVLATPPRPPANTLRVSAAMPNPTRGPLLITLDLPRRTAVKVTVHDVLGRQVRLVEDDTRDSGVQGVAWDGQDSQGRRVAPGLYMVRVDAGGERFARRVVVSH
jgi:hypothetical protein